MQDFIPNAKRSRPAVSFSVSADDRQWLKTTAEELGINRSDLLQRMILILRRSGVAVEWLREVEVSHEIS